VTIAKGAGLAPGPGAEAGVKRQRGGEDGHRRAFYQALLEVTSEVAVESDSLPRSFAADAMAPDERGSDAAGIEGKPEAVDYFGSDHGVPRLMLPSASHHDLSFETEFANPLRDIPRYSVRLSKRPIAPTAVIAEEMI
jgi:hypothetical protein